MATGKPPSFRGEGREGVPSRYKTGCRQRYLGPRSLLDVLVSGSRLTDLETTLPTVSATADMAPAPLASGSQRVTLGGWRLLVALHSTSTSP